MNNSAIAASTRTDDHDVSNSNTMIQVLQEQIDQLKEENFDLQSSIALLQVEKRVYEQQQPPPPPPPPSNTNNVHYHQQEYQTQISNLQNQIRLLQQEANYTQLQLKRYQQQSQAQVPPKPPIVQSLSTSWTIHHQRQSSKSLSPPSSNNGNRLNNINDDNNNREGRIGFGMNHSNQLNHLGSIVAEGVVVVNSNKNEPLIPATVVVPVLPLPPPPQQQQQPPSTVQIMDDNNSIVTHHTMQQEKTPNRTNNNTRKRKKSPSMKTTIRSSPNNSSHSSPELKLVFQENTIVNRINPTTTTTIVQSSSHMTQKSMFALFQSLLVSSPGQSLAHFLLHTTNSNNTTDTPTILDTKNLYDHRDDTRNLSTLSTCSSNILSWYVTSNPYRRIYLRDNYVVHPKQQQQHHHPTSTSIIQEGTKESLSITTTRTIGNILTEWEVLWHFIEDCWYLLQRHHHHHDQLDHPSHPKTTTTTSTLLSSSSSSSLVTSSPFMTMRQQQPAPPTNNNDDNRNNCYGGGVEKVTLLYPRILKSKLLCIYDALIVISSETRQILKQTLLQQQQQHHQQQQQVHPQDKCPSKLDDKVNSSVVEVMGVNSYASMVLHETSGNHSTSTQVPIGKRRQPRKPCIRTTPIGNGGPTSTSVLLWDDEKFQQLKVAMGQVLQGGHLGGNGGHGIRTVDNTCDRAVDDNTGDGHTTTKPYSLPSETKTVDESNMSSKAYITSHQQETKKIQALDDIHPTHYQCQMMYQFMEGLQQCIVPIGGTLCGTLSTSAATRNTNASARTRRDKDMIECYAIPAMKIVEVLASLITTGNREDLEHKSLLESYWPNPIVSGIHSNVVIQWGTLTSEILGPTTIRRLPGFVPVQQGVEPATSTGEYASSAPTGATAEETTASSTVHKLRSDWMSSSLQLLQVLLTRSPSTEQLSRDWFQLGSDHVQQQQQSPTCLAKFLLSNVLDILEWMVRPQIDELHDLPWLNQLAYQSIRWMQCLLLAGSSPSPLGSNHVNHDPFDKTYDTNHMGVLMLRTKMATTRSTSDRWSWSCSACGILIDLLHRIVVRQHWADHLPESSVRDNVYNPLRDEIIVFMHGIWRWVQQHNVRTAHKSQGSESLPEMQEVESNERLSFLGIISEQQEAYISAISMLLTCPNEYSSCWVSSDLRLILQVQIEDIQWELYGPPSQAPPPGISVE